MMVAMHAIAVLAGAVIVAVVLWEAFETLVLPRRVTRRLRFTRIFYRVLWGVWSFVGRGHPGSRRENYLSVFAPLSLLMLLAVWVGGVVIGFALILWGVETPLAPRGDSSLATDLYLSATTFVTLGLGDVTAVSSPGRAITAVESAAGFAFLALTISYLPVLYQAFSRREVSISTLDEWAGSPPTGVELLRRPAANDAIGSVDGFLADWERWSAELLESHLSYPVLAYFRSQHERQSWLAAMTAILDASALVLAGVEGVSKWQARRVFAISRHAVVDLAHVLNTPPVDAPADGARRADAADVRRVLEAAGVRLGPRAAEHFDAFRAMYEPFIRSLSARLEMPLPALLPGDGRLDDWQRSAWDTSG
jgi:ion channel